MFISPGITLPLHRGALPDGEYLFCQGLKLSFGEEPSINANHQDQKNFAEDNVLSKNIHRGVHANKYSARSIKFPTRLLVGGKIFTEVLLTDCVGQGLWREKVKLITPRNLYPRRSLYHPRTGKESETDRLKKPMPRRSLFNPRDWKKKSNISPPKNLIATHVIVQPPGMEKEKANKYPRENSYPRRS